MKKVIFFFLLTGFLQNSFAQFTGVLNYEDDYSNDISKGKVVTTIYESKLKARIESRNTPERNGQPDMAAAKDQNIIFYDFDKQTVTRLNAKTNTVSTISLSQADIAGDMIKKMGSEVSVQNLGPEKIGNYSCIHFIMKITNPKVKTPNAGEKDIWITKDLGISNVYYSGVYLYYPQGSFLAKKLLEAGATGIVVKWKEGSTVGNLISYQTKNLPESTFIAP
jgi:hypothetical protein